MALIFDIPAASVAIAGSADRFPVRRIFCVGRNYLAHVREMGNDERDPPFFFTKPADAVVEDGATIPYPPQTDDLHHEAELVVAIGQGGRDIREGAALDHVWGYGVGNDLTRRDLQAQAKKMGRPWDWAKAFDASAPIAPLHPTAQVGHPSKGAITAHVDGELRQQGDLSEMIWPVPSIIAFLSASIEIRPGDLIMTGTPSGVGPLVAGQTCVVEIEGLGSLTTTIA
ncbi:fumarylacetoacetate hydrolase family protein [Citreimonas sp.]|uniref:fumarylacetoacetate hydrolase family protein n=1 Tax=Citreimonas sp. TaxID=3036715 RepID=UPI0035C7DC4B